MHGVLSFTVIPVPNPVSSASSFLIAT
jgi:hypothetical protein